VVGAFMRLACGNGRVVGVVVRRAHRILKEC
jgi:hypothetical protein